VTTRRLLLFIGVVAATAAITACGADPISPDETSSSGLLVTFDVNGEQFRVWVTNRRTIGQLYRILDGLGGGIPNGGIRRGPGFENHNAPWNWHLDADDIRMAEVTTAVCNGSPSQVEAQLDDYIAVGRYCPWDARLVSFFDRR
jgi:hypothetical protein